ncbi:unnamed protein product [marine sediment metagenome]|uniref:Uncharacterized protein n=1 Tax=marine sediment metagenome TaxID=412755 RepID=X1FXF8_9ZZZZ
MELKATAILNKVCHELGVCESEAVLRAPGIKHAAELWKDGSKRAIRVACWEDGKVTSCVVEVEADGKIKQEICCYTAEDGGDELYYAWQAHLTSPEMGYKIKTIEAEKTTLGIKERVAAGADVT